MFVHLSYCPSPDLSTWSTSFTSTLASSPPAAILAKLAATTRAKVANLSQDLGAESSLYGKLAEKMEMRYDGHLDHGSTSTTSSSTSSSSPSTRQGVAVLGLYGLQELEELVELPGMAHLHQPVMACVRNQSCDQVILVVMLVLVLVVVLVLVAC